MSRLLSIKDSVYELATGRMAPRKTVYRGITFRSQLEVRFAWLLDSMGEQWTYEPRPFGSGKTAYLPDFEILGLPQPTFIEVKPLIEDVEPAARKMEVIWKAVPDALLIVACWDDLSFYAALRGRPWEKWLERWAA